MKEKNKGIAVCGLMCHQCDIFQASSDPVRAQQIADWFKKERGEDVRIEEIRCSGCRGDRTQHWSPDCWIRECCVNKKGLEFCCECEDFPCEKLNEWAEENEGYGEAVNRLKEMKDSHWMR